MKYDITKRCFEVLKQESKQVGGKLKFRKRFYLNEETGYISFEKVDGYTLYRLEQLLEIMQIEKPVWLI